MKSDQTKISILFCIHNLTGGGAEKLLIDILHKFDTNRFELDLLVLHPHGIYFDKIPKHVNWYTYDTIGSHFSKDFDIEVAFLEGLATRYIAYRNSNALKIAWVHIDLLNFHWTYHYFANKEEEEWCYSRMNKIIFVSENTKEQFNRKFPDIKTLQQVIYNLIDRKEIETASRLFEVKKNKFTLCSVGRLCQAKGFIRVLPVIKKLIDEGLDFEYWILGAGEQHSQIQGLIITYSLQGVVFLKGFQKNPYPYVKAADIFVLPSFVEGFSLALCEAVCLGKPILSTPVAGASEILDDGRCGLIVEQDALSIYDGLRQLIKDETFREQLSIEALKRSDVFNVENTMQQIYELFIPL
jgi:glycosyltransferase involved in cell wall biosynthesis